MHKIKLAAETYTWQMPGEQYKGRLEHIMEVVSQAGFKGIEPETSFLKHLADPLRMKDELDKYGLDLAVLCYVEDWRGNHETEQEKRNANEWIEFLQHFPNTILLLVQMPGKNREELNERQNALLSCVNAIAQRATDRGITCSYHPNSPMGSIFRTEEDYKILLNGLNPQLIKYTPDTGHIAKAGMDPLTIIKQYQALINCIHYKDIYANGKWAPMGEGVIDLVAITNYLISINYEGWIVMEDECDKAITDPDSVTLAVGEFNEKKLMPFLR